MGKVPWPVNQTVWGNASQYRVEPPDGVRFKGHENRALGVGPLPDFVGKCMVLQRVGKWSQFILYFLANGPVGESSFGESSGNRMKAMHSTVKTVA